LHALVAAEILVGVFCYPLREGLLGLHLTGHEGHARELVSVTISSEQN